jgi:Amidohydrolase
MRIDAYTHFIPKQFFEAAEKIPGAGKDIGKRMRGVPCIYDLDERRRIVGLFPDYAQILSYPMPPLENFLGPDRVDEFCRMLNDGFAEIVAKHPDQFPGFVAQVSLASPAGAVKEAKRAIDELGACGVQIFTNVNGAPIDRPQYEEFWATMEKIGKPIWIHPARTAERPDYVDEKKSLYEIWWTFGWSYETAAAMARLVFSKVIDRHPDLKLIVHHFGGIVPILEGRIGPGWDQLGARTSDEDYVSLRKSLKKRPLDYFKQNFYADAADPGVAQPREGREGEDLLQEPRGDHGEDIREVSGGLRVASPQRCRQACRRTRRRLCAGSTRLVSWLRIAVRHEIQK